MKFKAQPGRGIPPVEVFFDEADAHLNSSKLLGTLSDAELSCAPGTNIPLVISRQQESDLPWLRLAEQQLTVVLVWVHQGLPLIIRGQLLVRMNQQDHMAYVTVRHLEGPGFTE